MSLILDHIEHYEHLVGLARLQPAIVRIATYGIWAGIMADGRDSREWNQNKFHSYVRDFLEVLRSVPRVQILVGVYGYSSCRGNLRCEDCEAKYVNGLIRLLNHVEKFDCFEWRLSCESHAKCSLFYYRDRSVRGVTGGRNMTDSDWADVSVDVDAAGCAKLTEHFGSIWKKSVVIDHDSVNAIIDKIGISLDDVGRLWE